MDQLPPEPAPAPAGPPLAAKVAAMPDRRRNITLLVFSILGFAVLTIRGTYMIVSGIGSTGLASGVLGGLAMFMCGFLLFPMMRSSLKRLAGKEIRPATIPPIKAWQFFLLFLGWAVSVAAGQILNSAFSFGWAIASPFFLLGIVLPILALVWIGVGGLPLGSRHRLWSVTGIGLAGSPAGAILLEYLFVGIGLGVAALVAITNPAFRTMLENIQKQLTRAGDIQSLVVSLAPYLTSPWVILLVLLFASVLAPMIEEAMKPAVLWLLGKRLQSPAEGFAIGVLCGAGFAMLEGLTAASGATDAWAFGMIARAAASLMHITCSGILGWGIASAMISKRYKSLPWIYLLSVGIHGLWNGSALVAVYGSLRMTMTGLQMDVFNVLIMLLGVGMLGIVLVLALVTLPVINHQLRPAQPAAVPLPAQSDIIAPPQS